MVCMQSAVADMLVKSRSINRLQDNRTHVVIGDYEKSSGQFNSAWKPAVMRPMDLPTSHSHKLIYRQLPR